MAHNSIACLGRCVLSPVSLSVRHTGYGWISQNAWS